MPGNGYARLPVDQEPEDADAERSGIARSLEGIYEWWKDPSTSWRDPSTWHDPRNPARLEGEEEGGRGVFCPELIGTAYDHDDHRCS